MTLHYITAAFRSLKMNKVYSVLSIGGFAVGFSICTIVGIYAYQELRTDKTFPDTENLFRLVDKDSKSASFSTNIYKELNHAFPEIEVVIPYNYSRYKELIHDDEPFKSKGELTCTDDFFNAFTIRVISQMGETPFVDDQSIVLTESFAKTIFGDENPLGMTLSRKSYNGNVNSYTVTAIVTDMPRNTSIYADCFRPTSFKRNFSVFLFIKLKDNVA